MFGRVLSAAPFAGILRWYVESKRSETWKRASRDWKQQYPECAICLAAEQLEAHDIVPYHTIPDAESKTYEWWMMNLITLCRKDHRAHAHCNDPDCYRFNPKIRELAAEVTEFRQYYCTR